jgi:hypothetical protein
MKQNKLKRSLLIAALIMSVLLPNTARSNEDICTPVVEACDRTIGDQGRVIDLKTRVITAQSSVIDSQDKAITALQNTNSNSIFKSPLLYIIVGMVAGGILVGRAK